MAAEQQPTSESLMRRYQERLDEGAFEQLAARFLRPALATARQLLPERGLAEDAVQETFLRLVRRRGRYDPSRRFSAWFYTILRNVCTDALRRQARQARAIERAGIELLRQRFAGPPARLDPLELLERLPPSDRAVLTLRIVHDMAFRDVAAALGVSEEAAKKRAQRALRRLRDLARDAERQAARAASPAPQPAATADAAARPRVPDAAPRAY